ncbi:MAG: PhoH family protein [Comamonadaceae bacterium]|nr:PhoH family protein [Comamonadaceae bacterium]
MPLPPPPKKRASLLAPESFVSRPAAKPSARKKAAAPANQAAAADAVPAASAKRHASQGKKALAQAPSAALEPSTAVAPATAQRPASTRLARQADAIAPQAATSAKAGKAPAKKAATAARKLFVLDTNVLMHDPTCLFRFEEHDIYLALIVLEEMDSHKKGSNEVARNVRQASRMLDALVAAAPKEKLGEGIALAATGHSTATGDLFFQTQLLDYTLPAKALPQGKADNQILGVVAALEKLHPKRQVVLVSKDINMRVKARALGLAAEDYENDKALGDDEVLYSGALVLPADFWENQQQKIESWQEGMHTFYRVHGPLVQHMLINQFVYFEQPGEASLYTQVVEIRGDSAVLKTLRDCTHPKQAAWGVTARNREQNFAMNLLLDPEIDLVTLAGHAGTGKTLLALACGLTQVLDERRYSEIIMTRATVNVAEDIGFLPGTEEEKMGPWMGALDDNLEFLTRNAAGSGAGEWGRAATQDLVRSRIKIKSMNFMRGRTFMNKYLIIDEAQNLTPKQMKTLITRAGPGTKIICMGNLAQIDTPYLTEGSSGLTSVVDKFKGWPHSGHITLARGERSRLADFASEVL